ncbi:hypothetical protein RWE15_18715 [Virgibacillus halophilus]|uniref:Uncharacterized protein n=1 Tax=Tigheibacillus halophilus TaxID=361280 RepID=A0ABU5CB06_9BACI|nr:hypothetical protein [Virgibacillus halophilus]
MDTTIKQGKAIEKFSLMKNRNYLFLLLSASFSAPGYYVYLLGCEWLMLSLSDNRFYFGMLFFCSCSTKIIIFDNRGGCSQTV